MPRVTHGMTGTPTYVSWQTMMQRCLNANSAYYKYYGGRGITVCNQWRKFSEFHRYMGDRPSKYHSIERIDTALNYEPGNCRWATKREQQRNKRDTVRIEYGGETKSARDWADKFGISFDAVRGRLRLGWPLEKIFTTPVSKTNNVMRRPNSRRDQHGRFI